MIRQLLFRWFFKKGRYAEAVACLGPTAGARSSQELHALFGLGLYETIATSARADDEWRGGFATAVSLAACGRAAEAAALARDLWARNNQHKQQAALAAALAPFDPALAWELIESCSAPATLRAALLLRLGRSDEALRALHGALAEDDARRYPELSLFLSNAKRGSPESQLAYLNSFLASHALAPLALRDASRPPSPINVRPASEAAASGGPLVSVLMTAWCTGKRIESAIDSLLAQSYRDIELIVVDDASDDDTGEVVKAIAARDSRVVYLRLPCNVGTYVAKSIGLQHAKGEFITCQDSDDWAHPSKIERQVRPLLENRKLVLSTSHWVRMSDEGEYYARPVHPLKRMNPASPLFRKDAVLARAGGWDPVRTGADSEFAARLKLVFGEAAMHRVAEPLTLGSHRADSLMNAAGTGYSATGISPTRLAYWEAWGHWHIGSLARLRRPKLPVDLLAKRRFAAPEAIIVPREEIEACLAHFR